METDSNYTLSDGFNALWDLSILETLPEEKQSGNVFLFREGLTKEYLIVFSVSALTFAIICFAWKFLFTKIQHPNYIKKESL